jgi:dTDP-glucose 4,6-dehydratase
MNKSKALLVTGGLGFIGSHFIHYYLNKYPDRTIVNMDKLTYAGNTENLADVQSKDNYFCIHGDIADQAMVTQVFKEFDIQGVVHFAAESHVDKSIEDALPFITSNVLGTGILLETAKKDWQEKGEFSTRRFHLISTDEVYGTLGEKGKFTEETPYNPRNPYSATKASANMLVKSYYNTYGMNVVLSSSSNNYGPRQHKEKLIPTIIRKALSLEPIPIYGDGSNVRDWLYVEDHCTAIDMVYHHGKVSELYNVGGGNEKTNLELTRMICSTLDQLVYYVLEGSGYNSFKELITFVDDRPGHDLRYSVDDTKIRGELRWEPDVSLEEGMAKTIDWYITNMYEVLQ